MNARRSSICRLMPYVDSRCRKETKPLGGWVARQGFIAHLLRPTAPAAPRYLLRPLAVVAMPAMARICLPFANFSGRESPVGVAIRILRPCDRRRRAGPRCPESRKAAVQTRAGPFGAAIDENHADISRPPARGRRAETSREPRLRHPERRPLPGSVWPSRFVKARRVRCRQWAQGSRISTGFGEACRSVASRVRRNSPSAAGEPPTLEGLAAEVVFRILRQPLDVANSLGKSGKRTHSQSLAPLGCMYIGAFAFRCSQCAQESNVDGL